MPEVVTITLTREQIPVLNDIFYYAINEVADLDPEEHRYIVALRDAIQDQFNQQAPQTEDQS